MICARNTEFFVFKYNTYEFLFLPRLSIPMYPSALTSKRRTIYGLKFKILVYQEGSYIVFHDTCENDLEVNITCHSSRVLPPHAVVKKETSDKFFEKYFHADSVSISLSGVFSREFHCSCCVFEAVSTNITLTRVFFAL